MRTPRIISLLIAACVLCIGVASATSPLLTNSSFAGNSFSSWTATTPTYTGACSSSTGFASVASPAEDADGGASQGSSGASMQCAVGSATIGETQPFTINGTPIAQTYSFWYNITQAVAGDPVNCIQGAGNVSSIVLNINGTQFTTTSPIMDGAWHQVTNTMTALRYGSNTITITSTNKSAHGTSFNPVPQTCSITVNQPQATTIDNIVLSATLTSGQQWIGSWRLRL